MAQATFPRDRIFFVYGHSRESITNRKYMRNGQVAYRPIREIEKAEQAFKRFHIPCDTFTATTVPVGMAAPNLPASLFLPLLKRGIPVPSICQPPAVYKQQIQDLGKIMYANTVLMNPDMRRVMSSGLSPSGNDYFDQEPPLGPPQQDFERFRTHGPKHPMLPARRNTRENRAASYFLFSQAKNEVAVFTADSATVAQIDDDVDDIYKYGMGWNPSGAMRLTDLEKRMPKPVGEDPIFIRSLFSNYTFGEIRDNEGGCVTNLSDTVKNDFKTMLAEQRGEEPTAYDATDIQELLNEQIEIVKRNVVWNILPIPGKYEVLTDENFYTCKLTELFNQQMGSDIMVDYIRKAAGPGPILILFNYCRSIPIEGDVHITPYIDPETGEQVIDPNTGLPIETSHQVWRNNVNVVNAANPQGEGLAGAIYRMHGRPLVARTYSNAGQGVAPRVYGGGTRKKLKSRRRRTQGHSKRRR